MRYAEQQRMRTKIPFTGNRYALGIGYWYWVLGIRFPAVI